MTKVLLVDDEYLVCSFLKNLIVWEDYGFTIAGQASDGRQAVEKVRELSPSLVFLDVSMPAMDGTEVLRVLRSQHPAVKVVMLSSYSDFDYVRDTMKLGAEDYLLKHELTAEGLVKLLSHLQFDGDLQAGAAPVPASDSDPFDVVRDSRSRSFFEGQLHEVPRPLLGIGRVLPVAAKLQLSIAESAMEVGAAQESRMMRLILSTCVQISNEQGRTRVVLLRDATIVFLFSQCARERGDELVQRADRCMQVIRDALLKYHNVYIQWQSGRPCGEAAELPGEYRRMTGMFSGREAACEKKGITCRLTIELERRILLSVLGKSTEQLRRCMGEIFTPLLDGEVTGAELTLLAGELLSLAVRLYQENGVPFPESGEHRVVHMELRQVYSYFSEVFLHLIRSIDNAEAFSKPVMSVLHYVQEHYREEFGLPELAAHCGLNASYLSTCFKRETGMNLVQYINRVRIYAAGKRMLMENAPPTQVFEEVGFRNYNNFFNLFKAITGMAPKQFKERATVDWISSFEPLKRA